MKIEKFETVKDLIIVLVVIVLSWFIMSNYDVAEIVFEYLEKYEKYELDEIVLLFSIAGLLSIIFAYRRIKEAQRINKQFLNINKNLREEIYLEIKKQETQKNSLEVQEKKIIIQTTDTLTQLPNRQKLLEESLIENLKLAIFKIVGFKQINEYYGFDTGDIVLKELTIVVKRFAEYNSLELYKLHGSEFALLATSDISCNKFISLYQELSYIVNKTVIKIENNNFDIKIRGGISFQKDYLVNAEISREYAKQLDKSFIVFDDNTDIKDNIIQNIHKTKKLKKAVEDERIVVFAQPIISNSSKSINKYECLVRMIDEENNIISPFDFLELAKKSNIYSEITSTVINKSFEYFSKKDDEFSINLTIEDILNHEIFDLICYKLKEFPFLVDRVIFEIVEDEGIENFEEVSKFIEHVKGLGCKIAIDDFGTGYSNFEYLMKLNVDYIKIDGSLIRNLDSDLNSKIVTQLIVDFARKLDITTIAEFVHSKEIHDIVQDMKIDYSQGFYLGKPEYIL